MEHFLATSRNIDINDLAFGTCTLDYLYSFLKSKVHKVYRKISGIGIIHGWDTTFGTKDLRTMLHWISAFIMIYYYLINKF